ncbi:MAG TPA: TIGR02270 family protein [Polyangium sp.]|nr:TIGR02270 family protein [Polyangium sp.]
MDLQRYICEEHAAEVAFLWTQRDRAVLDPSYDRADVATLDERLETHLDGLRHAAEVGVECATGLLDEELGPGEAFVATLVAIEQGDVRAVAHALDVAGEETITARGIVSALGWAPWNAFEAILPGFLSKRCPPALQRLGLRACAIRRHRPPEAVLELALSSADPRLRADAIRTVGELKHQTFMHHVHLGLDDPNETCRFWAAWSGTVLGGARALESLWTYALRGQQYAELAAMTAGGRLDARRVAGDLQAFGHVEGGSRAACAAAAALGDPLLVPWLLEQMQEAKTARRAGLAFSLMTGVNLGYEPFEGRAPADISAGPTDDADDEDVATDPDEDLPFPNVDAVRDWWKDERDRFVVGNRYLNGNPLTDVAALESIVETGNQMARALAALHLTLSQPRQVLPEVRSVAWR